MAASRASVHDSGDHTTRTPGQAGGGAAGGLLPVVRGEGDEPAVGGVVFGSDGAAGDGPAAFGADAFRALLRSHLRAIGGLAQVPFGDGLAQIAGKV